jgi:hypothetical protein
MAAVKGCNNAGQMGGVRDTKYSRGTFVFLAGILNGPAMQNDLGGGGDETPNVRDH